MSLYEVTAALVKTKILAGMNPVLFPLIADDPFAVERKNQASPGAACSGSSVPAEKLINASFPCSL